MKNPFSEFRRNGNHHQSGHFTLHSNSPTQHINRELLTLYNDLSTTLGQKSTFVYEHSVIDAVYKNACTKLAKLNVTVNQLEDLAFYIVTNPSLFHQIPAYTGLFLSALCNTIESIEFFLEFPASSPLIHCLGYRFSKGKTLHIDGNTGDFFGANLSGGHLILHGNARDWVGLGMGAGKIEIKGSCGRFAGEWMRAGSLSVTGKIRSLGLEAKGHITEGMDDISTKTSMAGTNALQLSSGD